jgi:phage terminase large subunit-like protein
VEQLRSTRGVGEGTQHARHILQRRRAAAALGERTGGLALEVDHDPIARAIPQHLAEVVVAVDPRDEAGRANVPELLNEIPHRLESSHERRVGEGWRVGGET